MLCDRCKQDVKECNCEALPDVNLEPEVPPSKQKLQLRIEKRKRGKVVSVVADLGGSLEQKQRLLKQLKNACGAGGTLEGNTIEIQGKQLGRISEVLQREGFRLPKSIIG